MKSVLLVGGFVLFIISVSLNIFLVYTVFHQKQSNLVKVIGVIDGDTVVLENKTRLRLRQVDAPELGMCGASPATDLLSSLTFNKSIRIEEQIPDQTGRAMALIYIDKILANEVLLASGWVRYHSDTTSQTPRLKEVSSHAKAKKKGIFSELCLQTINPENPNCIIKGNLENKRTSGRKIYYLSDCAQYKFVQVERDLGERWFCTEKEASAAGYIKADTCPKFEKKL